MTIPPLLANTELTFTLTVTGRAGSFAGGVIPGTDTASVAGDATTATTGIADADGLTSPTYTYQWIRVNGDGMSNPADIPDATFDTYTLATADLGKKLRVQVRFTDDENHTEELTSAAYPASGTVAAAPTPNLTVGSPSVTNNNPEPGEVFTLSATVTNTGDKDAPATTLWFYQSTDTTITTSDPSPGTEPVGALAAGATSPESKDVTAPATAGTYYYGACVDPVPNETNTTNNCSQSVQVTVSTNGGGDDEVPPSPPPPSPGGGGPPGDGGPRQMVPDAPRNFLADGGNEQVALSWDAPEDDGGLAITDYQYRINGRGSWISIDSTYTTHTVTGLANGTAYVFQVRAVNAAGSSPYSNRAESTPGVGALDFAHFANGTGITSDLVFVNVATHPIRLGLDFYDKEWQPY